MAVTPTAPCFPGLPGYPRLAEGLRELGLRHAGELIWPGATKHRGQNAGFQILDGFRVRRAGHGTDWWLVDRKLLAEARIRADERFPGDAALVQEVFDIVNAAMTQDVMILRHLVLYQLLTILGERGSAVRDRHVTKLGVDDNEAADLAALAAAVPRFGPQARDAAERLLDEAHAGRLRTAMRMVEAIPDGHGDERLARLCAVVRERTAAADALLTDAERLAATGEIAAAAEVFRVAANRLLDDPRPRAGLLGMALRLAAASDRGLEAGGQSAARVTVTEAGARADGGVSVHCAVPRWIANGATPEYEFWRITGGNPDTAECLAVVTDLADPVLDNAIAFGETVSYAVIPRHARRVCGPPAASAAYRHAPDVRSARLVPTPFGVRARWRTAEQVSAVRVLRFGPHDPAGGVPVASRIDGFDDAVSGSGECRYEVRCGYPDARGEPVWSAGWIGSVHLAPWPAPVEIVRVEVIEGDAAPVRVGARQGAPDDDLESVRVTWRLTGAGAGRMTVWPYTARWRGDDVSHLINRLPEALADEPGHDGEQRSAPDSVRSAVVCATPGSALRLTGVSLLGERAVAGDSVLIFLPAQLPDAGEPGLRLRRVDENTAEAVFSWPEPATLVRMVVEQEGREPLMMVLPRSLARKRAMPFPVSRAAVRVLVQPLVRPDAALAFAEALTGELPALPVPVPVRRSRRESLPVPPVVTPAPDERPDWAASVPAALDSQDLHMPEPAYSPGWPQPPAILPSLGPAGLPPGSRPRAWRSPRTLARIVLNGVAAAARSIRSFVHRSGTADF